MATRSTLSLLVFVLFSNLMAAQEAVFKGREIQGITSPELEREFMNWSIYEIDAAELNAFVKREPNRAVFWLQLGDTYDWNLTLYPDDIRSQHYSLRVLTDKGVQELPKGENNTFAGFSQGIQANHVRMTLDEDFIFGFLEADGETYFIEPAMRFKQGLPANYFVVYRTDAVRPRPDLRCGWAQSEHRKKEIKQQEAGEEKLLGNCYKAEIALASDFSMFQVFGSSAGVQNFMLGVLNNVQTNYDTEFADEIRFEVVTEFIVTTSGGNPWSASNDAATLLNSFANWGNTGNFGVPFDFASLWTNRDFAGTTIGVAWLGGLCTDMRYSALQNFSTNASFLRVLQAHEIGHLFNADHDPDGSNTIMAPSVNSTNTWSNLSISVINSFISDVSAAGGCFSDCVVTAEPPVAAITSPAVHICAGSVVPLIDKTTNNPTSWNWIMPGATPSSSSQQHPTVRYNNPGNYVATLIVSNSQGTDIADLPIQVDDNGTKYLLYETFEGSPGPWDIVNPDNGITWEWVTIGGSPFGKKAMKLDNFNYTSLNQKDGLISPSLDLSIEAEVLLEIDYAYRRFNATRSDKLIVSVSTNGGITFPTVVFQGQETGGGNFATATDSQSAFTPGNANDWCFGTDFGAECLLIDLSAFSGEPDVRIRIENQTGHGNNLYIDNVRISSSCASLAAPTPALTSNVSIGCAPLTVQFEDISTGVVSNRSWSFPGGNPNFSEDLYPLVTYNTPGTYDVSLTVSNAGGVAVVTETGYITVLGSPTANFSASHTNLSVQTTNLSTNATSYVWNFGDGTPTSTATSPAHTYAQPGTYTIRLTANNECGQSVKEISVTVTSPLTATFSATLQQGCAPLTVTFNDQSVGNVTAWMWTFEGGTPATSTAQNPTVSFNEPGSWTVSLTVSNGTLQNTTQQVNYIVVTGPPTAAFTTANPLGSNSVEFTNASNGASSYTWDFGDGTGSTSTDTSHTYEADGTYTVTLIATNACGSDTTSSEVFILLPPVASWEQNSIEGCEGLSVQFNAAPQGSGLTYAWTFEGGSPASSDLPDPTVTYAAAGNYAVQLIVTNAAGADTTAQNGAISVLPNPQAAFTASGTLGQAEVHFSNTSSNANAFNWDFGDGNGSNDAAPSHTYEADGTYTVTLIATNACGSDTTSSGVFILLPPVASWEQNSIEGCEGLSVQFNAAPQGSGLTYAWTFEGGSPASSDLPDPTVTYAAAGNYAVQLIVTNAAGADTTAQNGAISVLPNPQAAFTASGTLGQAEVQFSNTSSNANAFTWDFGDGNGSNDAAPSHTYEADGTYTVTLIATNACGNDTTSSEVFILLPPVASWEQNSIEGCEGLSVQFNAAPQGPGLTYAWTFEGGSPASSDLPDPTVTYAAAGNYAVQLIVTNAAGADTTAQNGAISVLPNPQAAFTANGTLGQAEVHFSNTSSNANAFNWDFGDGNGSNDAAPSHTYEADGTYTVTLIAANACGNDTTSSEVNILLPPVASWEQNSSEGCEGLSVQFNASPQGSGLTYAWTFEGGSPASSDLPDPTVTYAAAGNYAVQLIVTNAAGTDTTAQNGAISVLPNPQAAFTATGNLGQAGVQFSNTSSNANAFNWDFGDGNGSNDAAPSHTYEGDGTYTVTLIAANACGSDTTSSEVNILLPPVASWEQNSIEGCEGLSVQFNAAPQGSGLTYAWTFEGGSPASSDLPDPTVTYAAAGNYAVQLIVTNAAGADTIAQNGAVVVSAGPTSAFTASINGFEATFENNSEGASTYFWDFGDLNISDLFAPGHVYNEDGVYTVVLITTNSCGSDTSSITITIDSALPVAAFDLETGEGCAPLTVYFFNESVNADSIHWSFPGGTPSESAEINPVVTYENPGTYNATIVAYNTAGSAAMTQMNIISVPAAPVALFDIEQDQASVNFINNAQNASAFEWHFGDGTISTEANPSHTYSESGDYLVFLIAKNACGSDTISKEIQILIVGSTETTPELEFKLFPNPNDGNFFIELKAFPAPVAELTLFDALGQLVHRESISFQSGQIQKSFDLDRLSAGVFWLSVKTKDFYITRKVIFQY